MIEVRRTGEGDPMVFRVRVEHGGARSEHRVTLSAETYRRFATDSVTPERCIEAAFRYLLERESPGEILSSFDFNVIRMYFPSFEQDFPSYL